MEELVKDPTKFGRSLSLGSSRQRALATEMAALVKDSSATPRSVDAYLRRFSLTRAPSGLATIATKPHKPVRARRYLTARC